MATVSVLALVSGLLFVELSQRERQGLVSAKLKAANMALDVVAASLSAPIDFVDATGTATAIGFLTSNTEVECAAAWAGQQAQPVAALRGPGAAQDVGIKRPLRVPYEDVAADHIEIGRAIVDATGSPIGQVAARFSLASENAAYRSTRLRLLGFSLGVAVLTAWLLIAIARHQIIVPLDRLIEASRSLEYGEQSLVEVRTEDEVGRLGRAFNNMSTAIVDRQRRLDAALSSIAQELELAKQEVRVKERLEREMELARRIQSALLPRDLRVQGLELAAKMIPATEVGGDYYDVLPWEGGCWLGIGDVSGHGVSAGLIMLMAQSAISALTKGDLGLSPRDVLAKLNGAIYDNIRNRLCQDEFMTLSLLRYDVRGSLRIAGAHEDIIVCHLDGVCEVLATQGTWLGLVPDLEDVTVEREYRLTPGDVIVLHTDGITEALNAEGIMFGFERLCAEVARVHAEPVEAIRDHLLEAVRTWSSDNTDDRTLIVGRYTGTGLTTCARDGTGGAAAAESTPSSDSLRQRNGGGARIAHPEVSDAEGTASGAAKESVPENVYHRPATLGTAEEAEPREANGPAFGIDFQPEPGLLTPTREFLSSFLGTFIRDLDATTRIAMAVHELLENAIKYSSGGCTHLRVELRDHGGRNWVAIRARNRATPERVGAVHSMIRQIHAANNPFDFYCDLMRQSAEREEGSGLGLARISGEADVRLDCAVAGDELTIYAEASVDGLDP